MTFYEQLQLGQAGSKAYIKQAETSQERTKRILIFLSKIVITLAFCVAFVGLFGKIFGTVNSTAGVVLLLFVLVFRQVDLGICTKHGAYVMLGIGAIMIAVPKIATMLSPIPAFFVHFLAIFGLTVLGCHQVQMRNQGTIVMAYILLLGYPVSGMDYVKRAIGLALGFCWIASILYRSHKNKAHTDTALDLYKQFDLKTDRSFWQLGMPLTVSVTMLVAELLHFPRVIWVGFAALSVTQMLKQDRIQRTRHRLAGVLAGVCAYWLLMQLIPMEWAAYLGMFGGFCVGFCVHYRWQTMFNCFGALSMATILLGVEGAAFYRLVDTVFGALFALAFYAIYEKMGERWKESCLAVNQEMNKG